MVAGMISECSALSRPKPSELGNRRFCPRCKQIKELNSFYTPKINTKGKLNRLIKWCISCNQKHVNAATRKYKKEIVDYMGGKCCRCGYDKCLHALDIHHTDPEQKDPNFKQMRNILTADLKRELEKCILVCSNCHREIHTEETLFD